MLAVDSYFHVIDADEVRVLSDHVTPDEDEAIAMWRGIVVRLMGQGVEPGRTSHRVPESTYER